MTKNKIRMTKFEARFCFVIRVSDLIRHSDFVIRI